MRCSGMDARRGCRRWRGLRRQDNAGVAHPSSTAYLRQTVEEDSWRERFETPAQKRGRLRTEDGALGLDRGVKALGTEDVGGSDRLCEERWGHLRRVTNEEGRVN